MATQMSHVSFRLIACCCLQGCDTSRSHTSTSAWSDVVVWSPRPSVRRCRIYLHYPQCFSGKDFLSFCLFIKTHNVGIALSSCQRDSYLQRFNSSHIDVENNSDAESLLLFLTFTFPRKTDLFKNPKAVSVARRE